MIGDILIGIMGYGMTVLVFWFGCRALYISDEEVRRYAGYSEERTPPQISRIIVFFTHGIAAIVLAWITRWIIG